MKGGTLKDALWMPCAPNVRSENSRYANLIEQLLAINVTRDLRTRPAVSEHPRIWTGQNAILEIVGAVAGLKASLGATKICRKSVTTSRVQNCTYENGPQSQDLALATPC